MFRRVAFPSWVAGMTLAAGIPLAAVLAIAADHAQPSSGSVKPLAKRDIVEKLGDKPTAATAVEVSLGPGQSSASHRHPGPVLGYVLEGQYEWAIDDQPAKILSAGDTFYEPGGCLHRVSKNPGNGKTRVLAWVIHPRDAAQLVIPDAH